MLTAWIQLDQEDVDWVQTQLSFGSDIQILIKCAELK